MSTTEPAAQPPAVPEPQDIQRIFEQAQQAAERAETAAQRLEAVQTASAGATREKWPDMPDEFVERISKAVVDTLSQQYDLGPSVTPSAPGASPATGAAPPPASAGGSASSTPQTGPGPSGSGDPAPPRSNIAKRILGY